MATRKETEHLLSPRSLSELHEDVLDLFASGATGNEKVCLKPVGRRGYISVTVANSQNLPARRRTSQHSTLLGLWLVFMIVIGLAIVIGKIVT